MRLKIITRLNKLLLQIWTPPPSCHIWRVPRNVKPTSPHPPAHTPPGYRYSTFKCLIWSYFQETFQNMVFFIPVGFLHLIHEPGSTALLLKIICVLHTLNLIQLLPRNTVKSYGVTRNVCKIGPQIERIVLMKETQDGRRFWILSC